GKLPGEEIETRVDFGKLLIRKTTVVDIDLCGELVEALFDLAEIFIRNLLVAVLDLLRERVEARPDFRQPGIGCSTVLALFELPGELVQAGLDFDEFFVGPPTMANVELPGEPVEPVRDL